MQTGILDFILTEHFLYKSWDRSIDKVLLYKILPYVNAGKFDKKVVIITPSFYNSKGIIGKPEHCLVLILKHNLIKTGFWCKTPNYLFKKEKQAEFQLIFN